MKILITGASGSLGSRLVPAVHKLDVRCGVLLRPSSQLSNEILGLKNLSIFRASSKYEVINAVESFEPDLIVHTACNYGLNGESYKEICSVNIDLGLTLIQSLNLMNAKKVFININTALPSDVSHYAKSKHYFSKVCEEFSKKTLGNFQFIDLITHTIYGHSLANKDFISQIITQCLDDISDLKLTSGFQKRDFIYIDDVISSILLIISKISGIEQSVRYELGSGIGRTIKEVVMTIHSLSNSKSNLRFGALAYRTGEPMNLVADNVKLRLLGWTPTANFEQKIKEMIHDRIKNK